MPSHLIPRSYSIDLIDDPGNIRGHCLDCSMATEAGNYDVLDDAEIVKKYIEEQDPVFYRMKTMKDGP